MDLRDLLSLLRSRWIVIVAASLVCGLAALGMSLLITPTYQAKIQFYVTVAGGDNAASAAYQGSLGAQQRVQSYAALVKSSDVASEVIKRQGLDLTPTQLVNTTTASADARTVLLDVIVTDTIPKRALELAEGFGDVLPETIDRLESPDGGGPALAKLTVVNPPELPSAPIAPQTERNVAIGLLLGLMLGTAIAVLVNLLDRRVTSSDQLESITGKPVVGSIPFRQKGDREKGNEHIVPFRDGHSPAAESFRRLRTNLGFLNVDRPPKIIVLTSSVATEGKSETAVNLVLALAEAGNSVLLIEADLRRPRVVNYMAMPDTVGITNVLSGQAKFDDVVQETRYGGVDLLGCGPLPPNPSELLSSDTARRLFSDLKEKYDYVIIDSPPLLPVTDGALLARIADGALLVVRANRTTTDQVLQSTDNLQKADAPLLGVIMVENRPVAKRSTEYYNSYYYSSRGAQSDN